MGIKWGQDGNCHQYRVYQKAFSGFCLSNSYIKFIIVSFYRYACSLLRQDMKQIVITLDSPDIVSLEKQGDKEALAKVHDQ